MEKKASATSDTAEWATPHHADKYYIISLVEGRHHGRLMAPLAVSLSTPTFDSVPLVTRVAVTGCDIWAAQRVGKPQVA